MDPITSTTSLGITLSAITLTYSGVLGAYSSRLKRFSSKTYDENLRSTIERYLGTRSKKIKAYRRNDTEHKNLVFEFTNVSILDLSAAHERIEEALKIEAESAPHEDSETSTASTYYNVKLTIADPNITLGEIDFCDWTRNDFSIKITKQETGETLDNRSEEAQNVLETLRKYPKVSLANQLTPNQIAKEEIAIAGNLFIDFFKSMLDDKTRTQSFAIEDGQNSHLQEAIYYDDLISVAVKRAAKGDYSVFKNYYETIEHTIDNELFAAQKTHKQLEDEIKLLKKGRWKKQTIIKAASIWAASTLAILGALSVISPTLGNTLLNILSNMVATVTGLLNSNILAVLNSIGASFAVFGLLKAYRDYAKEELRAAKDELKEVKAKEQELQGEINKIHELKNKTLEMLDQLSQGNNFQRKNITDMEMVIICRCLNETGYPLSAEKLLLNNNKITNIGLKALALTLTNSQAPKQPNLIINTIDISNNKIDEQGILELSEALTSNFTLTTLIYNTSVNSIIQNNIDRELLINRYLQGAPFGELEEKINIIFPTDGLKQLKLEAEKKLERNFNFTAFSSKMDSDLKPTITNTMKQNILFQKLAATPNPTATEYIEAFTKNPDRSTHFFIDNLDGLQISSIQKDLAENIPLLINLDYQACRQAIQSLFINRNEDTQKNIDLFARIIHGPSKEQMSGSNVYLTNLLQKAFSHLDKQNHSEFKERIKYTRKMLAENSAISKREREAMLKIIDSALYPKLTGTDFKKMQLEKLVTEHPSDLQATLQSFISIYKTIPNDQIKFALSKIDQENLTRIIRADIAGDAEELRDPQLSSQHRQKLLEICFSPEESETERYQKAVFLDAILGNKKVTETFFSDENFRENYFRLAFPWPGAFWGLFGSEISTFDELKTEAEKLRIAAVKAEDQKTAELLDKPLQIILQNELTKQLALLREDKSINNLDTLKNFLDDNTELRQFDLKGIDFAPEIKAYIELIMNRNKMHDAITNCADEKQKIEIILEIYQSIDNKEQRQHCMDEFLKLDSNSSKFIELIKHDAYNNDCTALRGLSAEQIQEFIKIALRNDPHAEGKATIASSLFDIRTLIGNQYIWGIFAYPGLISNHRAWSFTQYIDELKKLQKSKPNLANTIEEIIQTGLKKDLISRFECLRRKPQGLAIISSFDDLQSELGNNYDLTNFNSETLPSDVVPEIKEYITFICKRNLVIQAVSAENLIDSYSDFFDNYAKIPAERCDDILNELGNSKILELVNLDLGSDKYLDCQKLLSLDLEHRTKLLNRCFLINETTKENAYKKAIVINRLFEILEQLEKISEKKESSIELQAKIKYEIFWALTSGGSYLMRRGKPYHELSELLENLHKIADKLPSDIPQNITANLTSIPDIDSETVLKPSSGATPYKNMSKILEARDPNNSEPSASTITPVA